MRNERKILFSILIISLIMICGCGKKEQAPKEPTAAELLADALAHYDAGDYEESIISYTAVIEIDPWHGNAYEGLAKAYLASGEKMQALDTLREAVYLFGGPETAEGGKLLEQWKTTVIEGIPAQGELVFTDKEIEQIIYFAEITELAFDEEAFLMPEELERPKMINLIIDSLLNYKDYRVEDEYFEYEGKRYLGTGKWADTVEVRPGLPSTPSWVLTNPEVPGEHSARGRYASAEDVNKFIKIMLDIDIPAYDVDRCVEGESVIVENGIYYIYDDTDNYLWNYYQISKCLYLGDDIYYVEICGDDRRTPGKEYVEFSEDMVHLLVQRNSSKYGFRLISVLKFDFDSVYDPEDKECLLPDLHTFADIYGTKFEVERPEEGFSNEDNVRTYSEELLEALILEGNKRVYDKSELLELSQEQLALVRNGMYALSGEIFSKAVNRDYFSSKSWYLPVAEDVSSLLNYYQEQNIALCVEIEDERGW